MINVQYWYPSMSRRRIPSQQGTVREGEDRQQQDRSGVILSGGLREDDEKTEETGPADLRDLRRQCNER